MPDLTGVRAKLEWASEHRRAYDALFESFIETEPYSIAFDFDAETGWHTFRWNVTGDPPLVELALIFSDIVGNLRSTLDYLVWQLVLLGGERPGRKTMFPIVKREKDWAVQGTAALRGVPEQWAQLIEDMQPFHRFDAPELHPLAILEHVNNLTKHRFLPAAVLSADAFGYMINIADLPPEESFESRDSLDLPVVDGGELARFRAESRRQVEVQIGSHPRFRLSFRDGVAITWAPIDLVEWVREAVAQFEPAFLEVSRKNT